MMKLLNLKFVLITNLVFIILLGSTQLILANEMSSEGQKIKELEERKILLEGEVQALEKEIAALGSLTRIQRKAEELGLVRNSQAFEYLSPPKLAQVPWCLNNVQKQVSFLAY